LAIFHLSAHDRVSRSAGQTSVASAAYIMRAKFTDERTGQGYDFRHYSGAPEWAGMFSLKGAPEWTHDAANAEKFWNALELFEKRKDAQVAVAARHRHAAIRSGRQSAGVWHPPGMPEDG